VPDCNTGFDDCEPDDGSGNSDDGCETELALGNTAGQTVNDCGACGRDCSLEGATASACTGGRCVPVCDAEHEDCDEDDGTGEDNGCETSVSFDTQNCGACGYTCSAANTSSIACNNGVCAPTCATGFLNCSLDDGNGNDDGCETVSNTTASCGTNCGNVADCEVDDLGQAACTSTGCEPLGLAVLSVPFTAAGQAQRYSAVYPDPGQQNLLNDVVHLRLYAPGATGGSVNIVVLDGMGGPAVTRLVELSNLSDGWVTISIPMGPAEGDWDPSAIRAILLDTASGTTGPWTNPTILYVDRIWSDNRDVDDQFEDDTARLVMATSGSAFLAGSSLDWIRTLPTGG
jgi:hypothetical protein